MTTTLLKRKEVKTRKVHRCWGCWHPFPAGSSLLYEVYADSGEIVTSYTCSHCEDWMTKNTQDWDLDDWECLMRGDIGYWKDGQWHPQAV